MYGYSWNPPAWVTCDSHYFLLSLGTRNHCEKCTLFYYDITWIKLVIQASLDSRCGWSRNLPAPATPIGKSPDLHLLYTCIFYTNWLLMKINLIRMHIVAGEEIFLVHPDALHHSTDLFNYLFYRWYLCTKYGYIYYFILQLAMPSGNLIHPKISNVSSVPW